MQNEVNSSTFLSTRYIITRSSLTKKIASSIACKQLWCNKSVWSVSVPASSLTWHVLSCSMYSRYLCSDHYLVVVEISLTYIGLDSLVMSFRSLHSTYTHIFSRIIGLDSCCGVVCSVNRPYMYIYVGILRVIFAISISLRYKQTVAYSW